MMLFRVSRLILVLLLFSLASNVVRAQDEGVEQHRAEKASKPLVFGVAPFMSPVALVKRMSPLRDYLSRALKQPVIIETTKDAKDFMPRALSGRYDLVLGSPTFALMMTDKGLYSLGVTQNRPLTGHLVVLADSPVMSVEELAGKKIGTPPAVGFLGQLSRPYFEGLGLKGDQSAVVNHFHSHNDAIAALRLGETQASLIAGFMEKHLNEKGIKIRTIARSEAYPGLTILTSPQLEDELAKQISEALLALGKDDDSAKVLQQISMPAFRDINARELEKVRPYLPGQTDD